MAMGEIIDFVGYSIEGLAGWRYLLSPTYRRRVHERWSNQSKLETVVEVIAVGGSFILVTLMLGGLVWWLFANRAVVTK